MPNHVKSQFVINGECESIKKIADRILVTEEYLKEVEARNSELSDEFKLTPPELGSLTFDRLIPVPTNVFLGDLSMEDEEKYGKENCWYGWNIKNWGTKWDAYEVSVDVSDNCISVEFWTAWEHPQPYMEALAKVCAENGCDLNGEFANEDFGSLMGTYSLLEEAECDGNRLRVQFSDYDGCLYENVWGCPPFDEEEECEQ